MSLSSGGILEVILMTICDAVVLCIEVHEANMLTIKVEFSHTNGTVTVFFNENFGNVRSLRLFINFVLAMNEHDNVSILFDRT